MDFSETLKKLRIRNNYSQALLAEKLNIKQYVISSWETSRSEPSIKQLIELSKIFNVPCDYLLGKDAIMVTNEESFIKVINEFMQDSIDDFNEIVKLIQDTCTEKEKKEITSILKSLYNLSKTKD